MDILSKPPSLSFAVVCTGKINGCILYTHGYAVQQMIEDLGSDRLDDIGLDDAPSGLSIWEGNMAGGKAYSTQDGVDYTDTYLVGTFRPLTDDEWLAVRNGKSPFENLCEPPNACQINGQCYAHSEWDEPPVDQ